MTICCIPESSNGDTLTEQDIVMHVQDHYETLRSQLATVFDFRDWRKSTVLLPRMGDLLLDLDYFDDFKNVTLLRGKSASYFATMKVMHPFWGSKALTGISGGIYRTSGE